MVDASQGISETQLNAVGHLCKELGIDEKAFAEGIGVDPGEMADFMRGLDRLRSQISTLFRKQQWSYVKVKKQTDMKDN
jgi:hypothetical protein